VTLERSTQAAGSTSKYNRTLCYDILGILRRCFTHECEVRLHLYNGTKLEKKIMLPVLLKN